MANCPGLTIDVWARKARALQLKLASCKKEIASLTEKLTTEKTFDELSAVVNDLENKKNSLQQTSNELTGKHDALSAQVSTLEKDKVSLVQESATLKQQRDALSAQVGTLTTEKESLEQESTTFGEQRDALSAQVSTLEKDKVSLVQESATLAEKHTELSTQVGDLTTQKDSLEKESAALQQECDALSTQVDVFKTEKDSWQRDIDKLKQFFVAELAEYEAWQMSDTVPKQQAESDDPNISLRVSEDVEQLQQEIAALTEELDAAKEELKVKTFDFDFFYSACASNTLLQTEIAALKTTVENAESKTAKLKTLYDESQQRATDLDTQVQTMLGLFEAATVQLESKTAEFMTQYDKSQQLSEENLLRAQVTNQDTAPNPTHTQRWLNRIGGWFSPSSSQKEDNESDASSSVGDDSNVVCDTSNKDLSGLVNKWQEAKAHLKEVIKEQDHQIAAQKAAIANLISELKLAKESATNSEATVTNNEVKTKFATLKDSLSGCSEHNKSLSLFGSSGYYREHNEPSSSVGSSSYYRLESLNDSKPSAKEPEATKEPARPHTRSQSGTRQNEKAKSTEVRSEAEATNERARPHTRSQSGPRENGRAKSAEARSQPEETEKRDRPPTRNHPPEKLDTGL